MADFAILMIVIGLAVAVAAELDVHWCRVRRQDKPPEDIQ